MVFFENVLVIYKMFIDFFLNFEIMEGLSLGYIFIAVCVIGAIYFYLVGRLK